VRWRRTPERILIRARKLAGDGWIDIEMSDLLPGDVFRAVAPDGEVIHPVSGEPDGDVIALVTDFPIKNYNNQIGSLLGAQGYGVPIEVYPSMDELNRKGLS